MDDSKINSMIMDAEKCSHCGKDLAGMKPFIERRWMYGEFKDGKIRWGLFCLECQPFSDEGEKH